MHHTNKIEIKIKAILETENPVNILQVETNTIK